jgi:drug/metabolite transporter (DMT)-like permease
VVLGFVGALVAIRARQAMLYEVKPGDPSTMLAVVAGFAAAALVACYLPLLEQRRSIHQKRYGRSSTRRLSLANENRAIEIH